MGRESISRKYCTREWKIRFGKPEYSTFGEALNNRKDRGLFSYTMRFLSSKRCDTNFLTPSTGNFPEKRLSTRDEANMLYDHEFSTRCFKEELILWRVKAMN